MTTTVFSTKLGIPFALLIALLLAVGGLALDRTQRVGADLDHLVSHHWRKVQLSREALGYSTTNNRLTMQVFFLEDRAVISDLLSQRLQNTTRISALVEKIGAQAESEREKALLRAVAAARVPYVASYQQSLKVLLEDRREADARAIMVWVTIPLLVEYHAAWNGFVAYQGEEMNRKVSEAQARYLVFRRELYMLVPLSICGALAIALFVMRRVARDGAEREAAQSELRSAHDELEHRVLARTADLSAANEALHLEIAERKHAEDELRKLSRAVEQNPACIVITDPKGQIEYVNPKFSAVTGYALDEVLGQNPRILKSGETPAPVYRELWATITAGREWHGEFHNRKKDGGLYWELASISPIMDDEGQIVHFVAVKEDVTERRTLELELAQAHKLESVGQLAGGIAHEINTPMQFISDNASFLKDAFQTILELTRLFRDAHAVSAGGPGGAADPRLDAAIEAADLDYLLEEIPRAIDQSIEGAGRVSKIVRAMKEFSHPDQSERTPTDLNRAIDTTVTVARNEWKYVADVELDLAPDLPLVDCYAGEINQMLLNLIVNAAHAIAARNEGGTERGTIRIATRAGPGLVEVRVADTGTGIRPEHRHRIFEQFFTTKPVGKGTGQGLAMAYRTVVARHGGTITFESVVGQGTTFVVTLPSESTN